MATDTLDNMVRSLRAEAGHSLNVAQGVNQLDTLKYILKRTQEELWTAFDWPTLEVRVNCAVGGGVYLYNWPAGMTFDQVRSTWWAEASSAEWYPVGYGIDESRIKPDDTNTQTGQPVQFWEAAGSDQFRIWPTPMSTASMRFKGLKTLGAFIAGTDVSTLDATCVVLFAAAELLARAKAEDAAMKLQKAQRHLQKLLGRKVSDKMKISTFGTGYGSRRPTAGIDYIPQGYGG